jgi:hypothetical protein
VALGTIFASNVFSNAQYGTGAVGLRNRGAGALNVSAVNKPVKAAYLYWAVLTAGSPPDATRRIRIQRLAPTASTTATLVGTIIGVGDSPCWSPTDRVTIFRAAVPLGVANGSGTYQITLSPGASGSVGGGDPWFSPVKPPLMEGASLVMVGTGGGRVSIYDSGLAGNTFFDSLNYTLGLPVAASGRNVVIDNIGADGQIGRSRDALWAQETTSINSVLVAGPGSNANDSDWNGAIAGPLPQLWDNTGHQINAAAPAGTTSLSVSVTSNGDCLVPVANVITEF